MLDQKSNMKQLDEIKKEITATTDSIKKINGEILHLSTRETELDGKLDNLNGSITAAENEEKEGVTKFARGVISENELDSFRTKISTMQGKRKNIIAALGVVDEDKGGLQDNRKTTLSAVESLKKKAWNLIYEIEMSKNIASFQKLWVAYEDRMPVHGRADFNGFIQSIHSASQFNKDAEMQQSRAALTREYLS